jgi:hypothetical protein
MSFLLPTAGAAIVLLAFVDLIWTTMSLNHAGPLTRQVSRAVDAAFRVAFLRPRVRKAMTAAGPVILSGTLFGWIVLLWIGWTLVFVVDPNAVVTSTEKYPGSIGDRIYYVGFTISTLGIGDFVPGDTRWRVLTALSALSGLVTITVGITYLLSVLSAVVRMRQTARYITSLARTPEALLVSTWNGRDFGPLLSHLEGLGAQVLLVHQQHHAYPILHHFYTAGPATAVEPALALLDEALTLLQTGVDPRLRPPETLLAPVRTGIGGVLQNLRGHGPGSEEPPPVPQLDVLRRAGIAVVDEAAYLDAIGSRRERRRLLLRMVRSSGWAWSPL